MVTVSYTGYPAEYTAGTMTANWLCLMTPDIYLAGNS